MYWVVRINPSFVYKLLTILIYDLDRHWHFPQLCRRDFSSVKGMNISLTKFKLLN